MIDILNKTNRKSISLFNDENISGKPIEIKIGEVISIYLKSLKEKKRLTDKIQNNFNGLFVYIPDMPSSFPWLNVKENISFFSKLSDEKILEFIKLVGLEGYHDHFPHNKSIGFRFRISFARALASDAEFIVIDNPVRELEPNRKREIFSFVRKSALELKKGILFIDSSLSDIIFLSDKIVLPNKMLNEISFEKRIFIDESDRTSNETKLDLELYFTKDELKEIL